MRNFGEAFGKCAEDEALAELTSLPGHSYLPRLAIRGRSGHSYLPRLAKSAPKIE